MGQHTGLNYPHRINPGEPPSIPELRMTSEQAYDQYITALAGRGGRLGMAHPPYLPPDAPTKQQPPAPKW